MKKAETKHNDQTDTLFSLCTVLYSPTPASKEVYKIIKRVDAKPLTLSCYEPQTLAQHWTYKHCDPVADLGSTEWEGGLF